MKEVPTIELCSEKELMDDSAIVIENMISLLVRGKINSDVESCKR